MNSLLLRKEVERLDVTMGVFPDAASLSLGLPFEWAELALYARIDQLPPASNPIPVLLELAFAATAKVQAKEHRLQIGRPYYASLPSKSGTLPQIGCAISVEFVGLAPYSLQVPQPVTLASFALQDLGVKLLHHQQ